MFTPSELADVFFNTALATGLLAVALLAVPLTGAELRLSSPSSVGPVKPYTKVAALFVAWMIDAIWFTFPATLIILAITAWKVSSSGYGMDFDPVIAPEAVVLKSFLVALNPVWYCLVQILNLTQATSASHTGYVSDFARVVIELLLPLYLYLTYRSSLPFARANGSAIVDYQNLTSRRLGFWSPLFLGVPHLVEILRERKGATTIVSKRASLTRGYKNRLFISSVIIFLVIALVQVSANLQRLATVNERCEQIGESFARIDATPKQNLSTCTYVLKTFRNVPSPHEKRMCLNLIESITTRLFGPSQIASEVIIERRFENFGSWIAPIPCRQYYEHCWRPFTWGGRMHDRY